MSPLGQPFAVFLWRSATPSIKTGYVLFNIASSDTASVILFAGVRFLFAGIFTAVSGSVLQRKILVCTGILIVDKKNKAAEFEKKDVNEGEA